MWFLYRNHLKGYHWLLRTSSSKSWTIWFLQCILSKLDDANVNMLEWLNSFVVVKKPNGKLCICLDPMDLNRYIVRLVCNVRTLDEIIALLKDAVHFAVFDSTKVPLDEASKLLTAMLTPVGIYIYNVLAMGLSNVTDIFESCI